MKFLLPVILLLLLACIASAGWNDMGNSSAENLQDMKQGRNISLSLNITNNGRTDGYAVYIINVTLHPPACVNGGNAVTLPGAIVCPTTTLDPSCRTRQRSAVMGLFVNFSNLATDVNCTNGLKDYYFTLQGSTELIGIESRWTLRGATNTSMFYLRFIGADYCGDSVCAGAETCTGCPSDCGVCPECAAGARACVNGSVYSCANGFFTQVAVQCTHGCETVNGTPQCTRVCTENETRCSADGSAAQTCMNNDWANQTCIYGCRDGACDTNPCARMNCSDKCETNVAYAYGSCSALTGNCTYFSTVNCTNGCNGTVCAAVPRRTPTPAGTSTPAGTGGSSATGLPCPTGVGLVLLAGLAFAGRCEIRRTSR